MRYLSRGAKQMLLLLGAASAQAESQMLTMSDFAGYSQSVGRMPADMVTTRLNFEAILPSFSLSESWDLGSDLFHPDPPPKPTFFQKVECAVCKVTTSALHSTLNNFLVHTVLVEGAKVACWLVTPYDRDACWGIINQQWGDAILDTITNQVLDPTTLCTFVLNLCDTDKWASIDPNAWAYWFVRNKPKSLEGPEAIDRLYDEMVPRSKDELVKVALLSDVHISWDYTPGMSSKCPKVLCCRPDSGLPKFKNETAGKWGNYKCDLPTWTFQEVLKEIREDIRPDLVFWAGDSIGHNLDSLTFETNVQTMQNVTQMIVDGLPDHKGKIFPAIGNHDTYPQDVFSMNVELDQNFQAWAPSWLQFIDDDENKQSFLKKQYFAKQINEKTRVLSLNTNICYLENWDAITAFNDPAGQLQWLIDNLKELEAMNGTAILLAHLPNLEECTYQFGHRFRAILNRYANTISFGIYSHVHYHELQVMRDLVTKQPTGINFIVSSATPYENKKPSIDVLYLDPDTMRPVEYEIYALDLDLANEKDEIRWFKYFDYRKDYQMPDLRPKNFFDLALRVFNDPDTCTTYYRNRFIDGPGFNASATCDRTGNFCQIVASEEEDKYFCQGQNQYVTYRFKPYNMLDTLYNQVQHSWYTLRDGKPKKEIEQYDFDDDNLVGGPKLF